MMGKQETIIMIVCLCSCFQTVSILMEYCKKQEMQLKFKELDSDTSMFKQQCFIDRSYYGLGIGKSKKIAKSDTAKKAFIKIVRDVYKEAGM